MLKNSLPNKVKWIEASKQLTLFDKNNKLFCVSNHLYIQVNKKAIYLGTYKTENEAYHERINSNNNFIYNLNNFNNMKEISKAILAAKMEMGNATKGSSNPFFKSKYADLNSIKP